MKCFTCEIYEISFELSGLISEKVSFNERDIIDGVVYAEAENQIQSQIVDPLNTELMIWGDA